MWSHRSTSIHRRASTSISIVDVMPARSASSWRIALSSGPVLPVASIRCIVDPTGNHAARVVDGWLLDGSPSWPCTRTSASSTAASSSKRLIGASAAATTRPGSSGSRRTPRTTEVVTSSPIPSPRRVTSIVPRAAPGDGRGPARRRGRRRRRPTTPGAGRSGARRDPPGRVLVRHEPRDVDRSEPERRVAGRVGELHHQPGRDLGGEVRWNVAFAASRSRPCRCRRRGRRRTMRAIPAHTSASVRAVVLRALVFRAVVEVLSERTDVVDHDDDDAGGSSRGSMTPRRGVPDRPQLPFRLSISHRRDRPAGRSDRRRRAARLRRCGAARRAERARRRRSRTGGGRRPSTARRRRSRATRGRPRYQPRRLRRSTGCRSPGLPPPDLLALLIRQVDQRERHPATRMFGGEATTVEDVGEWIRAELSRSRLFDCDGGGRDLADEPREVVPDTRSGTGVATLPLDPRTTRSSIGVSSRPTTYGRSSRS